MEWIHLAKDTDQWWFFWKSQLTFEFHKMCNILSPTVNMLSSLERIRSIELAAILHKTVITLVQFFDYLQVEFPLDCIPEVNSVKITMKEVMRENCGCNVRTSILQSWIINQGKKSWQVRGSKTANTHCLVHPHYICVKCLSVGHAVHRLLVPVLLIHLERRLLMPSC